MKKFILAAACALPLVGFASEDDATVTKNEAVFFVTQNDDDATIQPVEEFVVALADEDEGKPTDNLLIAGCSKCPKKK